MEPLSKVPPVDYDRRWPFDTGQNSGRNQQRGTTRRQVPKQHTACHPNIRKIERLGSHRWLSTLVASRSTGHSWPVRIATAAAVRVSGSGIVQHWPLVAGEDRNASWALSWAVMRTRSTGCSRPARTATALLLEASMMDRS